MGFFLSFFIFLMIVAVISFVSNQSKQDSNETIGKVKDWEAPVTGVQSTTQTETSSQATVTTQEPIFAQSSQAAINNAVLVEAKHTTSEAVLDEVFAELEKNDFEGTTTISLMSADEENMLDQLVSQLSPTQKQEESTSVSINTEATSSQEEEHANTPLPEPPPKVAGNEESLTELDQETSKGPTMKLDVSQPISPGSTPTNQTKEITCTIPEEEFQILVNRYGAEKLKGVTSSPAFGRTGVDEVMLGRVQKSNDRYFLTHHNSSIELSAEAALFVGEMVIASGTFIQDAFMKLAHIELLSVQEDEASSECFSVI